MELIWRLPLFLTKFSEQKIVEKLIIFSMLNSPTNVIFKDLKFYKSTHILAKFGTPCPSTPVGIRFSTWD